MKLDSLAKKIGVEFKDAQLLKQAMIHRSYLNEIKEGRLESNERLEFLGDAILSFVISEKLYQDYPDYPEGKLTNLRSNIVCTSALAKIAQQIDLGPYLFMSKGEKESGGNENISILANTVEAVIGAIFLDQGIEATRQFIQKKFGPMIKTVVDKGQLKDTKSLLQEKLQARLKETPTYRTLHQKGPDHDKTFTVGVFVQKNLLAKGTGKSKQEAEEAAAKKALEGRQDG